jgi:8-amino-7-oxononanoate synthase
MLDFTTVLYLGFRHSAESLQPWTQLTSGVPAALAEPTGVGVLASRLAHLQGCEQAIIGPSTLHLFWDLFTMLAAEPIAIFLDATTYPVAMWGVEQAAARGVPVRCFPHQDVDALTRLVSRERGRRPVIVSDGVCSGCGCAAPVAAYHDIVRQRNGLLVLDDTQALGLLGAAPDQTAPFGWGGGGSLRHQAVAGPEIILVSSLAKSFGTPLAALSGSKMNVRHFEQESKTRIYCSPPALPAFYAGARALALNRAQGESRRKRLARNVWQFRRLLAGEGVVAKGGLFPVQTLRLPTGIGAPRLHQCLQRRGLRTVLRSGCDGQVAISLIITARHRLQEIVQAVAICQAAWSKLKGELT